MQSFDDCDIFMMFAVIVAISIIESEWASNEMTGIYARGFELSFFQLLKSTQKLGIFQRIGELLVLCTSDLLAALLVGWLLG